jgi:SSS family solute:Na+ symporter
VSDAIPLAFTETNFGLVDWLIVVAYLVVTMVIGVVVKQYATSMANYIGAGRSLGTYLGVATMTGTELGLITVMYSAEKGFVGGFAAFHIAVMAGLVTLVVGMTGFIVAPLRELQVLTIPEYYEIRYGRDVRILGGLMLALGGILNMGLFLSVSAMFLVGVMGLSPTGWALPAMMTFLCVLVLIYTVLGGMISVVLTDYIQFVILAVGMIVVSCLIVAHLGWESIFSTVADTMGDKGFNPLVSEGAFGPEYVAWQGVVGLISCAIWPTAVARALAMESTAAVKRVYLWSSISFLIRFLIPYFWGISAFVFLMGEGSELRSLFLPTDGSTAAVNDLYATPVFLGRILPTGILGLIVAAMLAAFMSTQDSYLLCWSSVITQDIVAPLTGGRISTLARVRWTQSLIVLIGVFTLVWSLFYKGSDDIWDYMAITGAVYATGAIPLLIGGIYWKGASRVGARVALLGGFTAVLGLEPVRETLGAAVSTVLGSQVHDWLALESMTPARSGLISVGLTAALFIFGSLLFPDRRPASPTDK